MYKQKERKNQRRIFCLIFFVLMVITAVMGDNRVYAADHHFSVSIFSECMSRDGYYEISVEIKSYDEAFDGTVRINVRRPEGQVAGYETGINLAAEETKTYKINVPIEKARTDSPVLVAIYDRNDNKVYQEKFDKVFESSNDYYQEDGDFSVIPINDYQLEKAMGYMEQPATLASGVLSILIIFYVVLIGPVLYLILRAMKKRELIWIVIPAITLFFVGIIFLIGINIRVKGVNLNSVRVVDLSRDRDDTIIFGYSPEPKSWSFKTNDSYRYGYCINGNYSNGENLNKISSKVRYGAAGDTLTYYPNDTFDISGFVMNKKNDNNGILEVYIKDDGRCVVYNDTGHDLDYVYVTDYSGYAFIRNLADGQERVIDYGDINSGGNYYDVILSKYARDEYDNMNYDEAQEIAALSLGVAATSNYQAETKAIGVTKDNSRTEYDEPSYTCYYGN